MSYVESPGLRQVVPPRYNRGEKPVQTNPNALIEDLTPASLPEYLAFMKDRKPRADGYYQTALEDPKHWTVLVLRDPKTRKVVGGFEGEMFKREDPTLTPDPIAVAFVNWTTVEEGIRGGRYAATMIMEFERRARKAGMDFIMGNVEHTNHASLKNSARTGRREPYFRKLDPSGENMWGVSNWYHKSLGVLPEGSEKVIEVDYLSFSEDTLAVTAAMAMDGGGLGKVRINKLPGKKRKEDSLYSITAEDGPTREDFQVIMEKSVEVMVDGGDWSEVQSAAIGAAHERAYRRSVIKG